MAIENEYEAEQETRQRAHISAIRQLAIARKEAKNALADAEVVGVPPRRMVANNTQPTDSSIHGQQRQTPTWATALNRLHGTTLAYVSEARPYRADVRDRWSKPLITVYRPTDSGEFDTRSPAGKMPIHYKNLGNQEITLTLDTVEQWRGHQVRFETRYERKHGSDDVFSRDEKVYLPFRACHLVIGMLDDCLNEINMLAEVREQSDEDTDPGAVEDGDEWTGNPWENGDE